MLFLKRGFICIIQVIIQVLRIEFSRKSFEIKKNKVLTKKDEKNELLFFARKKYLNTNLDSNPKNELHYFAKEQGYIDGFLYIHMYIY